MKPVQKAPRDVSKITQGSRKRPTIKDVRTDLIKVDARVQRALIPARVKKLADNLDLDAIGIITVSERERDDYYVLDGQHRLEALKRVELGEWEVTCHVYRGLSLAQEAAFFRRHNDTRAITPYDDYSKGLVEGDPECLAIEEILSKNGFKMHGSARDGVISAVVKVREIFRVDAGDLLDDTLRVLVAAWGARAASVEKPILGGMAKVLHTFEGEVETAKLIQKLQKSQGGASSVLGKARSMKDLYAASVETLVAKVIVATYNTGKRGGRLDENI